MITTEEIERRIEGDRLPLLTVSEFFDGNTQEDSFAPNQWGYGRSPLTEIATRLRALEASSDIAWVRVELHPDTGDGAVCGESIAICTTATTDDLAARLDVEALCSDGVIEAPHGALDDACDIPAAPDGFRIVLLVWD